MPDPILDTDLPTFTGFAYVGVIDNIVHQSRNEPIDFFIDWESVQPTLEDCKEYADHWHPEGLIVQLEVRAKIVHAEIGKWPEPAKKKNREHPLFADTP